MAISDLSFKLYTDAALTTPFGTSMVVTHEADLSDNPRDYTLYLGSTGTNVKLEAQSSPSVDDVVLTPTDILPDWTASTAYAVGDTVEPPIDNTYRYVCTTAGTSDATEPASWNTTIGGTTADGTVVWTTVALSHQPTEITLALSAAALDINTAGAPLALGPTILSGTVNAVPIYMRIVNAVSTVSSNIGHPELALYINAVQETVQ